MDQVWRAGQVSAAPGWKPAYVAPQLRVLGGLHEFTRAEIPDTGGGELGPNIANRFF
jgi:hypothetical protein